LRYCVTEEEQTSTIGNTRGWNGGPLVGDNAGCAGLGVDGWRLGDIIIPTLWFFLRCFLPKFMSRSGVVVADIREREKDREH
jgi:hypothetical protein